MVVTFCYTLLLDVVAIQIGALLSHCSRSTIIHRVRKKGCHYAIVPKAVVLCYNEIILKNFKIV